MKYTGRVFLLNFLMEDGGEHPEAGSDPLFQGTLRTATADGHPPPKHNALWVLGDFT
jgi:hypothetical protein